MVEINTTICRFDEEDDEHEIFLTVKADYSAGEPMITSGPADRWHPGAPEEVNITEIIVTKDDGELWDGKLTNDEEGRIIEELFEDVKSDYADAIAEDYYDNLRYRNEYE